MKQKLTRRPKIAFYLDETALRRIVACIEEFQEVTDFNVEFSDETEITCNTVEEVLRIPNVSPREIRAVSTHIFGDVYLYLNFSQPTYFLGEAISPVFYSIEGEEKDVSFFASKLDGALAQDRLWYSAFTFRGFGLILTFLPLAIVVMVGSLMLLDIVNLEIVHESEKSTSISGFFYAFLAWLILIPVVSWLQPKLFPAAVFAIGDGIRRYKIVKNIQRVVFSTLGAIGLAVMIAVVTNLLGL